MSIVDIVIEKVDRDTDSALTHFLRDFLDFVDNKQQKIIDFYSGDSKELNTGIVEDLVNLSREAKNMLNYLDTISENVGSEYWELLMIVEDIDTRLQQMLITPRFLRSSITITGSKRGAYKEFILSEGDTLENLLRKLNVENVDDSWNMVAVENDLSEESYGDGTAKIKIRISNISSEDIRDVLDVIDGKSIYGKDVVKDFYFSDSDLSTLNPDSTLKQSVEILTSIKRGDIPEFPNFGLKTLDFIGGSVAQFSFPMIVRQLAEIFSRDDTLRDIKVEDVSIERDNVYIKFSISTLLGENVEQHVEL